MLEFLIAILIIIVIISILSGGFGLVDQGLLRLVCTIILILLIIGFIIQLLRPGMYVY